MNIYDEITQQIITELEKGADQWVKTWSCVNGADKNLISQIPYKGINRLITAMVSGINGYESPAWATIKQWNGLGARVRKDEKATKIIFWSKATGKDKETGLDKEYSFAKAHYIFNAAQVEGIQIDKPESTISQNEKNELCEARIKSTGAKIVHGGDTACFIPSVDLIKMPELGSFKGAEHYYATVFHELTHWTSDKARCDRDLSKGRFGNADYAFEELVAELGAAFMCANYGIEGDLRHAGYIDNWLKVLKQDNKAIFKASGLAQQAADHLMSYELNQVEQIAA
jgi:antirestriction protein ArdC